MTTADELVILDGKFVVTGPKGPFDAYMVNIKVSSAFPWQEPIVVETGDRIPKTIDRHIFPNTGRCCLGIWEEWLLTAPDHTFLTYLSGWLHDYFVSQTSFEAKGEWPYGERSHGDEGVNESYAELLEVPNDATVISDYLRLLARSIAKGHTPCPCGSGKILRKCHRDSVAQLRARIVPAMATRMLDRVSQK